MKSRGHIVVPIVGILLILMACTSINTVDEPVQDMQPDGSGEALLHFYFTSPQETTTCEFDSEILRSINNSQISIEIAMYNLNDADIAAALIAADRRGVGVRLVLDNDKADNNTPRKLAQAGIPIVFDPNDSTMHNKFMVIDGNQVWSGSMNFTESGCDDDYNNMVLLESDKIAANYQTEFREMFEDGSFSAESPANTPYPQVQVGEVLVETYFSPDDGVQKVLVDLIDQADTSIVFMAYSFTSDTLADAMIKRAENGVQVQGVMDDEQIRSNSGSEYEHFLEAGIPVVQDNFEGQMHYKVIVIDGEIVVTGSYNFSGNAEKRNDENVLVIHSRAAAAQYLQAYDEIIQNNK
jgi:phosphatidylserine/phosphatidylglycerophosphate/cardiolipin synthase-like enzyme